MLNATDDLWRAVRGFAAGERGSVVLGYGTSAGYETAPRLLEAIADEVPALEIATRVMATGEILDAVGDGALDAGLVRCPPARDGLEAHVVRHERQGVLLRGDHPLAAGASVALAQLRRRPRCSFTRAMPTRATTTRCSPSAARPASSRGCSSAAPSSTSPRRPSSTAGRWRSWASPRAPSSRRRSRGWRSARPPRSRWRSSCARTIARPRSTRLLAAARDAAARLGWLDGHAAPL